MLVAIPVTLALTLFVFYLYGYTLNRITLFALIFSIGILVDDAIVVVENIVRHVRLATGEPGGAQRADRVEAVDEVGNPTILATLDRDRRHPADGVRRRPDGPLHAADPGRRVGGDALLAGRRLHRHALGRACGSCRSRGAPRPRARRTASRALYRRVMARADRRADACADAFLGGRGRAAARRRGAGAARARHGEDAAVRQQERVPGHRRHARGHAARRDRARSRASWRATTLAASPR